MRLSDPQQLNQVLLKSAAATVLPVGIGAVSVEGSAPGLLKAHIQIDGTSEKHDADIYAAIALHHAESQVLRGENGGRRLTHVAVVQELIKIGKLEKGKVFTQDFHAKLKPGIDPKNLRLIVFVQEPNLGSVIGAALRESNPSGQ